MTKEKWNTETNGKWTAKLLPDITRWMERKFEEVDYCLTELLSVHGYFCKYMFKNESQWSIMYCVGLLDAKAWVYIPNQVKN